MCCYLIIHALNVKHIGTTSQYTDYFALQFFNRAQHKSCEVYKCSRIISTIINVEDLNRTENISDLLLPSSSLLKGQMDDGAIVHVVICQRVGIFDENTLENQTQYEILVFKVNTFILAFTICIINTF